MEKWILYLILVKAVLIYEYIGFLCKHFISAAVFYDDGKLQKIMETFD